MNPLQLTTVTVTVTVTVSHSTAKETKLWAGSSERMKQNQESTLHIYGSFKPMMTLRDRKHDAGFQMRKRLQKVARESSNNAKV